MRTLISPSRILLLEHSCDAFLHERLIRPCGAAFRRGLGQSITCVKHARGPARPAQQDIRVRIQHGQLLTDIRLAACGVAATRLGEHRLPLVGTQPLSQLYENRRVIRHALGRGAGVVRIEILVNVKDQVVGAAVEIGDLEEVLTRVRAKVLSGGVTSTGQEDLLRCGASFSDSGHGSLYRLRPLGHVQVMLFGMSYRCQSEVR